MVLAQEGKGFLEVKTAECGTPGCPKWMEQLNGEVVKDRRMHSKLKDLGYTVENQQGRNLLKITFA